MEKIRIAIIGASGYIGGELIRLLYTHPHAEIIAITSRTYEGQDVGTVWPNMRNLITTNFVNIDSAITLKPDLFFVCLPHGKSMTLMPRLIETGAKIVDTSADFRITNELYNEYYGVHSSPELLDKFVYGLPELHKNKIRNAQYVASPGCTATATILALAPIAHKINAPVIVDVKISSSAAGRDAPSMSVHHAERTNVTRTYSTKKHRHLAEIIQQTNINNITMTAMAINMVRGVLSTIHILNKLDEKEVRSAYRDFYKDSHFIRIVAKKAGVFRFPDVKNVLGSNFAEVGFDFEDNKIVLFSALDNEVKGGAGQAIQCMNLMFNIDETTGLDFAPLYPI